MATPIDVTVHMAESARATGLLAWVAANLPLLTLASTAIAGVFALRKWRTDEKWKRTAAAFERIKSFAETPGTRNAMMILKSRRRPIPVFDPANPPKDGSGIYRDVSWEDAARALAPTIWNADESPLGNAIRDSFEDFIARMTQIGIYLSAGLIAREDAQALVEPWGHRLRWDGDDGLACAVRVYVEMERFTAFQRLFATFGADLRQTIADDIERVKLRQGIDAAGVPRHASQRSDDPDG